MKTTGEEKEVIRFTLGQLVRYAPTGEVGTVEALGEETATPGDYQVWVTLDGGETREKVNASDLSVDNAEPT